MDVYDREDRRIVEEALARLGLPEGPAKEEERRKLEVQRAENRRAREAHRASLEAQQAAERRRHEAELDAELEPVKQRTKREWLASHPAATEADFERRAWPLLRQNLLEDRREQLIARTQEQLRQTGLYSL